MAQGPRLAGIFHRLCQLSGSLALAKQAVRVYLPCSPLESLLLPPWRPTKESCVSVCLALLRGIGRGFRVAGLQGQGRQGREVRTLRTTWDQTPALLRSCTIWAMCLFHSASDSLLTKQEVPTALAQVALTVIILKVPRLRKAR